MSNKLNKFCESILITNKAVLLKCTTKPCKQQGILLSIIVVFGINSIFIFFKNIQKCQSFPVFTYSFITLFSNDKSAIQSLKFT